jgi:hypothetical protein
MRVVAISKAPSFRLSPRFRQRPAASPRSFLRSHHKALALFSAELELRGRSGFGRSFVRRRHCSKVLGALSQQRDPPYARAAVAFIEHALRHVAPTGQVAMLLRTDFDHARSRQHLFGQCPQFARKVVLCKRIVWFDRPGAAPSFNHAWFIWEWLHSGPPVLAYA